LSETCTKFNSDMVTVMERCRVFEQSLGMLIKYALGHVEALQIMDVVEFMTHCKEALHSAESSEAKELGSEQEKLQDTLVVHYLSHLSQGLEDMDEDRIMDLIEKENIFPMLVSHMNKHYTWYRLDTLQASAMFFSNTMQSDAFTTESTRFVKDEQAMKDLVALKGLYIGEMVESFGMSKSSIQKLLDNLEKYEAIVGKTKRVALVLPSAKAK